jgi:hypothetical protein
MGVDGTRRREIRNLNDGEDNFVWTPDEKYLIYQSGKAPKSDIWLLPMRMGLLGHPGEPIRLTNGPIPYAAPYPSPDGKQIFVFGWKQRGELVRYDRQSRQFAPFLSGISATDPTFSRDGKWVAYASYPDHSLWRSRSDGSDRKQLTYPPTDVEFPSISPDGTRVSFHSVKGELFVIGAEEGTPQKVSGNAMYASWSPDGNYLAYIPVIKSNRLHVIDLRSGKDSLVPSSENVGGGFWLTEDALIVRNRQHNNFMTFSFRAQNWTELSPKPLGDIETWMISPDAKYIYYTTRAPEPMAMRLRVAGHQLETITTLKDLYRAADNVGQINVAPDGSPIFTRDTGYQEIYALNIRWP